MLYSIPCNCTFNFPHLRWEDSRQKYFHQPFRLDCQSWLAIFCYWYLRFHDCLQHLNQLAALSNFIRLSSKHDRLAPESHKTNIFSDSCPLFIKTRMTSSTPLLLIEDELDTSSTFSLICFCSTVLYGWCSNLWWGFPQPFRSHILPVKILDWCAFEKHLKHNLSFFCLLTSFFDVHLNEFPTFP